MFEFTLELVIKLLLLRAENAELRTEVMQLQARECYQQPREIPPRQLGCPLVRNPDGTVECFTGE